MSHESFYRRRYVSHIENCPECSRGRGYTDIVPGYFCRWGKLWCQEYFDELQRRYNVEAIEAFLGAPAPIFVSQCDKSYAARQGA